MGGRAICIRRNRRRSVSILPEGSQDLSDITHGNVLTAQMLQ